MKKIFFVLLLAAIALTGMAQTVGEAFYIYRNDGQFNAFFRDEIEKMEYSNIGADGVEHDEMVTQLVYTADSIYSIPLAAIDSVGFATPETVYKPGVINLQDGLQEYVARVNDNTITLLSHVPSTILPRVGDKIVTTDMNEFFPVGFAGEVLEVQRDANGVNLVCGDVDLEEVFECFYGYTRTPVQSAESRRNAFWDNWEWPEIHIPDFVHQDAVTYQPEPYHRELTQGMPSDVDVNIGNWSGTYRSRFEMDFAPTMWISGFVKIAHDERYFSVTITGDYSLRESFSYSGKLSWETDLPFNISIPIPVCPFLQVFFEPGLFVKAEAKTSVNTTFTQHFTSAFHYDWSSNDTRAMEPVFDIQPREHTASFEGHFNGELAFGAYLDIGIEAFRCEELASINGHAEIGLSVDGNVNLNINEENYTSSTLLYDMLKESYFSGNWYWGTAFEARLTPLLTYHHDFPFGKKNEIWRRGFVPTFSDVELTQCMSPRTSADAYLVMTGDCVTPVEVGLSVRDKDGNEVDSYFANTTFQNGTYSLSHTFTNLSAGDNYTLHPMVRINDVEMLASPSSDMEETEFPVKITDFEVTESQYQQGEYFYDGQYYDYRFDTSVTVSIDDVEDVADWGYVYRDPNGREKEISLKEFGTSYTDTRYAYFRNDPHSTACLYGYVKYVDDEEAIYDELTCYKLDYQDDETACPDENHPHMIDLGLPSGTKWACCNVGASAPEQYGSYFAWGETQTKSVYNWDTYQYYNDDYVGYPDRYINIGSDIAGTQYDAATANWGAPWRMPTLEQCKELVNNTTSVWTTQNGIYGRKFTGSNGDTIFLPAAGDRWDGKLDSAGDWGKYWSSTLYESDLRIAYNLFVYSRGAHWYIASSPYRDVGQPVRPVR